MLSNGISQSSVESQDEQNVGYDIQIEEQTVIFRSKDNEIYAWNFGENGDEKWEGKEILGTKNIFCKKKKKE